MMIIVVDTREQKPLWTNNVEFKTLQTGDYSIKGYEDRIGVERKSIPDLFSTLGKGHERFRKELERSKKLDYFCIVVEGTLEQVINKDFCGMQYTKMKGWVVAQILFTLHVKYGVNVWFGGSRLGAKKIIKQLLNTYYKLYNTK